MLHGPAARANQISLDLPAEPSVRTGRATGRKGEKRVVSGSGKAALAGVSRPRLTIEGTARLKFALNGLRIAPYALGSFDFLPGG
jgi:hypothetical protein